MTVTLISLLCLLVCRPVHTVTQKKHKHTKKTGRYVSSTKNREIRFCQDRKSFICPEGGKHNRTHTQAHWLRSSRHLWHALESVGLHRRYWSVFKNQAVAEAGAVACAHERPTGEVPAESASVNGHCPRYGRTRDRSCVISVTRQFAPLLGTEGRTLQCAVQRKRPVSTRNRELDNQL
jgi:hypothetical protein